MHLRLILPSCPDFCGRVLQSTDPANLVSNFNYNHSGQPNSAAFPAKGAAPAETISYLYGTYGRTENYTYNLANMMLTRYSNSYTNDADGNTLTGGERTNTWNSKTG